MKKRNEIFREHDEQIAGHKYVFYELNVPALAINVEACRMAPRSSSKSKYENPNERYREISVAGVRRVCRTA